MGLCGTLVGYLAMHVWTHRAQKNIFVDNSYRACEKNQHLNNQIASRFPLVWGYVGLLAGHSNMLTTDGCYILPTILDSILFFAISQIEINLFACWLKALIDLFYRGESHCVIEYDIVAVCTLSLRTTLSSICSTGHLNPILKSIVSRLLEHGTSFKRRCIWNAL